jgi:hypothetical protein
MTAVCGCETCTHAKHSQRFADRVLIWNAAGSGVGSHPHMRNAAAASRAVDVTRGLR